MRPAIAPFAWFASLALLAAAPLAFAAAPAKPDVAQMRAHLQHLVAEHRIQFHILLDTDGRLARRFHAQLLPTYVLIGPDGSIRRRFIGERTAAVFAAMLSETEKETVHP